MAASCAASHRPPANCRREIRLLRAGSLRRPSDGANACFTSLWKNCPPRATVPVNARGRKVYFLVAASTSPMQSQIENARITVSLAGGGNRVLPLVNPQNLDDWLCVPYAQAGLV